MWSPLDAANYSDTDEISVPQDPQLESTNANASSHRLDF